MIHYHGTPITPNNAAAQILRARHGVVSFHRPDQIALVAEVCQSFILDNGAYSAWKIGITPDWGEFYEWVSIWGNHVSCDWVLIPDSVEGGERANDALIDDWTRRSVKCEGVPVWHLHESMERLAVLCCEFRRIALGSSGEFATVGTEQWWARMDEAMSEVCNQDGVPTVKLHGLRMLNPTVFSHLPLSSADSTNVAQNIGADKRWTSGPYAPLTDSMRGLILAERIESHASANRWVRTAGVQENFELIG